MRYELTDDEWTAIKPMLPNKPRGVPRVNVRRVLNGIFWVLRSGAPSPGHRNVFGGGGLRQPVTLNHLLFLVMSLIWGMTWMATKVALARRAAGLLRRGPLHPGVGGAAGGGARVLGVLAGRSRARRSSVACWSMSAPMGCSTGACSSSRRASPAWSTCR